MPAILLRFLPYGLAVAAVLGAMWYLDHRGYQRAKADAEHERLVNKQAVQAIVSASEKSMLDRLGEIDTDTAARVNTIQTINRTIIQPTLTKELTRETRFADPLAGMSDGVRAEINRARNLSCAPRLDGGIECPLPPVGSDQ